MSKGLKILIREWTQFGGQFNIKKIKQTHSMHHNSTRQIRHNQNTYNNNSLLKKKTSRGIVKVSLKNNKENKLIKHQEMIKEIK